MQPIPEKINKPDNQSFFFKIVEEKHFSAPWHVHPEVEIFLVIEGKGTRYVGDGIDHFAPGDLAIIGSETPHVWSSNKITQDGNDKLSKGICIQFNPSLWGKEFANLPEYTLIKELIFKSKRGIKFSGDTKKMLQEKIESLPSLLGMKRLLKLFEILELMSTSQEYEFLSSHYYSATKIKKEDLDRIELVYQYVLKNYANPMQLEEVSALINLAPQSFCRYFKSRTNKVFSTFLNEVRIGHACSLLIENKMNVAQICYETGFNHLSNFNRQFKKIKKVTPSEFQKKYLEGSRIINE
ncbi:AraC family transcriptional regulator [Labilibacter sediminis]|nr:AraC family transcriptional regulator [Labilibacter sediminis]